jgi:histidinol-phosphate phosphatase family protein
MNVFSDIKQAVILAGGIGSRMQPLTDSIPKPMIEINDRPFLEYLVEQLRDAGIENILILLGYLPEKVIEHFQDGTKFGVNIDYSVSDVGNQTGRRLKIAQPKISGDFLLMYCDNYWPMRPMEMSRQFHDAVTDIQLTVYRNADNYTQSNLQVSDGHIIAYDKSRKSPSLQGVEIGYALVRKRVLGMLPKDENVSFERFVFQKLIAEHSLGAFLTDHRYYSIGSFARLEITNAFFERSPIILLDRDGVVNRKAPKAQYVTSPKEFEWLPGAKEAIVKLKRHGYKVILITNQAGIARGEMTVDDLKAIHIAMNNELGAYAVDDIYYCPHGWDEGCDCRKPRPGMINQAQRDHHIDLSKTFFIGDDERDQQTSQAAGCLSILVSKGNQLCDVVDSLLRNRE